MAPPPPPDAHLTGRPVASLTSAGRCPAVPAHQVQASCTRLAQSQDGHWRSAPWFPRP